MRLNRLSYIAHVAMPWGLVSCVHLLPSPTGSEEHHHMRKLLCSKTGITSAWGEAAVGVAFPPVIATTPAWGEEYQQPVPFSRDYNTRMG